MKKIISKKVSKDSAIEAEVKTETPVVSEAQTKKKCAFCQSKTTPNFTDAATLRKYLTDRTRIVPRIKTGVCAKHQRRITTEIKRARHLALLPFTPKV